MVSSGRTQIMTRLDVITLACMSHTQSTHFHMYPCCTIECWCFKVHKIEFQLKHMRTLHGPLAKYVIRRLCYLPYNNGKSDRFREKGPNAYFI